jgi:DNA-binding MarR family transcriptional regulator
METTGALNREVLDLVFDLSRGTRCCQQEAVFCEDLTFLQFYTLDLVAQRENFPLAELREALQVEKSTATRQIEPLIERGYLLKAKLPADGRALGLRLTPAGCEVHVRVEKCVARFVGALDEALPADQRQEVYAAVRLLLAAVQTAAATRCAVPKESE